MDTQILQEKMDAAAQRLTDAYETAQRNLRRAVKAVV